MDFKNWLYNEEDARLNGPGGKHWDLIYPSTVGDYGRASSNPKHHWWLQWRIKRGLEIGRVTHNIDTEEFIGHKYTVVDGKVPPPSGKFWEHKPDNGKGSTMVIRNVDLNPISIGPTADSSKIVTDAIDLHGFKDKFTVHVDGDVKINKLFDDKGGKWPEIKD